MTRTETANAFFEIFVEFFPPLIVVVLMSLGVGVLGWRFGRGIRSLFFGFFFSAVYLFGVTGQTTLVWVIAIILALYNAWYYTKEYL